MGTDHFHDFLDYLAFEKRFSPHTVAAYHDDLLRFSDFLLKKYEVEDPVAANYQLIRSWIAELLDSGIAARSVNRRISALRSYYRFLARHEKISGNPMLKIKGPKAGKKLPVFVEERQMTNLIENDMMESGEDDPYEAALVRVIITLLYSTGIRLAELLGIKAGDFDFHRGTVKVLGKRNKERIIPMTPELQKTVEDFIRLKKNSEVPVEGSVDFLLVKKNGKKATRKFVYEKVRKYLSLVTTIDKKSPHVLRHTFATHMLNNGADIGAIRELLGHANLAATQVYTHNSVEKLKSVHHKAHPRS